MSMTKDEAARVLSVLRTVLTDPGAGYACPDGATLTEAIDVALAHMPEDPRVILVGTPATGFDVYGPFDADEWEAFASRFDHGDWWPCKVLPASDVAYPA